LKIFAIVPAKHFESGKSRLSSLLNMHDRVKLSGLLLESTLSTLSKATTISNIIVVSSDVRAKRIAKMHAAMFLDEVNDIGVNNAVTIANNYCNEAGADATIVVPQDLPLAVPEDIDKICSYAKEYHKCLVVCPSVRYDGSNALLRRPPKLIESSYDDNSFDKHINAARRAGAKIKIILLHRIMRDLDTVEDAQYLIQKPSTCKPLVYLRSKIC
jgi:2-phospho-L-lactate guanylyltransferase